MDQSTQYFIVAIVSGLVTAVIGGGTIAAIAMRFLLKIRDDPEKKDYMERAFMSIPPEVLQLLREMIGLADEVTDGLPNVPTGESAKPKPPDSNTVGIMTRSFGSG